MIRQNFDVFYSTQYEDFLSTPVKEIIHLENSGNCKLVWEHHRDKSRKIRFQEANVMLTNTGHLTEHQCQCLTYSVITNSQWDSTCKCMFMFFSRYEVRKPTLCGLNCGQSTDKVHTTQQHVHTRARRHGSMNVLIRELFIDMYFQA